MYSITRRISALASYTFIFTTLLLVAIFVLSHLGKGERPSCNFSINSYSLRSTNTRYIYFSPKIDLSTQFSLNVKQVFLYITIVHGVNSDIIWSMIVPKSGGKKLLDSYFNNYKIPNIDAENARLELRGCIFPYVGQISDILYAEKGLSVE